MLVLSIQCRLRRLGSNTVQKSLLPHLKLSLAQLPHTFWDRLAGVLDEFASLTSKVVNRLLCGAMAMCQKPKTTAQRNALTWTSALSSISCRPRAMFSILCSYRRKEKASHESVAVTFLNAAHLSVRPALDAKFAAPALERSEADTKLLGCFVYRAAAVEDSQLFNAQVVASLSALSDDLLEA